MARSGHRGIWAIAVAGVLLAVIVAGMGMQAGEPVRPQPPAPPMPPAPPQPPLPPVPPAPGSYGSGEYFLPPGTRNVRVQLSAIGNTVLGESGDMVHVVTVQLLFTNGGPAALAVNTPAMLLTWPEGNVSVGPKARPGDPRRLPLGLRPGGRDFIEVQFQLPAGTSLPPVAELGVEMPYAYGNRAYAGHLAFVLYTAGP